MWTKSSREEWMWSRHWLCLWCGSLTLYHNKPFSRHRSKSIPAVLPLSVSTTSLNLDVDRPILHTCFSSMWHIGKFFIIIHYWIFLFKLTIVHCSLFELFIPIKFCCVKYKFIFKQKFSIRIF